MQLDSEHLIRTEKISHCLSSSGVERGGGRGASAPGPGPFVGARAKLDFLFFLIGSQWGVQDFDKGWPT